MRNDVIVHEGYNAARQLMVAAKDHTKHVTSAPSLQILRQVEALPIHFSHSFPF